MGVLTPELQFLKSQLLQVAEQIRAFADRNREDEVIDKLTPSQKRNLDKAAKIAVDTFLNGGFCDPKIGKCFGRFATYNIEELVRRNWQAPEDFRDLFDTLLHEFWYEKGIDVAPAYERKSDGMVLTKEGTIERWHQETIDKANVLEYLSAEVGFETFHSIESYKCRILNLEPLKDFRTLEEILSDLGAVSCQDKRFLAYFQPESKLLRACFPYDENIIEAQAELDKIKLLIRSNEVITKNLSEFSIDDSLQPVVQEIIKAIDWFLDLSPFDHTQMVDSQTGYQQIFKITWNSSGLNEKENALVETPNKIELVWLWCLANGQSSLGSEIKTLASKAFDCLKTFRTELSEQIEQWLWNNVRLSITKSDDLYSVYGEELLQSHEELIAEFTRLRWCFNALKNLFQAPTNNMVEKVENKKGTPDKLLGNEEPEIISTLLSQIKSDGREAMILIAMFESGIDKPATRKTQSEIIVLALGTQATSNDNRRPFLKLARLNLILKGANGQGFYLSENGINAAKELKRAMAAP